MNELLSNEEIDTLLDLFRSDGSELDDSQVADLQRVAEETHEWGKVSPVDLLKPNRLSRGQLAGLERHFENAAKSMTATISDRLRLEATCECVAVEQLRFRTWTDNLAGPVAIYLLNTPPFEQPSLLTVSTGLLYGAVDRILGGTGQVQAAPTDFTNAEFVVADAIIGPCLDGICESLREVVALSWDIKSRFCNPTMAQVISEHDVVISVYFQVGGEHLVGDLRLVMPFAEMSPHLELIDPGSASGFTKKPGELRDKVRDTVRHVELDLSVVLGQATIPLRTLLKIDTGDVIPLDTRIGQDLIAPVQGVPKFRGQVGTAGTRLAFRVGSVMED